MSTHLAGQLVGGRSVQGQSYVFNYDVNLSAVDAVLATIPASASAPTGYRLTAIVMTADNAGSSSVLRIGTSSGGTQLLNDVDLKAAAGTNYTPTNIMGVLTADTTLYARVTRAGGAATTGKFVVLLETFEINTQQPASITD